MVFNLFCDASIDTNKKIACAGCLITCQDNLGIYDVKRKAIIQLNATNNSSEILAIWIGVTEALRLRNMYPGSIFRLFSDSKISLYGLRDWIKNWVKNIDPNDNYNTLISSSGERVSNQQRFIDIFNLIVENNLRIEFYHQRGHVGSIGGVNLNKARSDFVKANKVAPEALGIDISYLSNCNNYVDNFSRDSLKHYLNTNQLQEDVELECIDPVIHIIRKEMLHQYIRCIDKTTVVSRHDFKGGYSQ